MELIFLLVIVIVIIKVAQRGNNRLPCQSEGYRRGYWDGVCDAQNGRAKIEGSDGQAKLITENQTAASQFAGFVVTRNESNEPDVVCLLMLCQLKKIRIFLTKRRRLSSGYLQPVIKIKRKIVKPPSMWRSITASFIANRRYLIVGAND